MILERKHYSILTLTSLVFILTFWRYWLYLTREGFLNFVFFEIVPKWWILIGIIIMVWFIKKIPIAYKLYNTFILCFGFVLIYKVLTREQLEKWDWQYNRTTRQEIVDYIKEIGVTNQLPHSFSIPKSYNLFPFSSNQKVYVSKSGNYYKVLFHTDVGLMDHYSGFVYTNIPEELERLNDKVAEGGNDFKLEDNWYLIHD